MIVPDWSGTIPVVNGNADSSDTLSKAVSGGTAAFGWSAPNGLENGKTLTVSSDTLTFEAPDKHIFLGFGQGWLYENAENTVMPSTVSVGSETIVYEGSSYADAKRRIVQESGVRYLRSILFKPENSNLDYNAGFLSWDTGSEIASGKTAFTFGRVRAIKEGSGGVQWKQERIGPDNNLVGENGNSAYIKDLAGYSSINTYPGNTQAISYGAGTPKSRASVDWSSLAWTWKQNTPDLNDGNMYTRCKNGASSGFPRSLPRFSSTTPPNPLGVIRRTPADKPRWIKRQDYIGNNNDNEQNIIIDVTDLYWKVGGDCWLIADNADLSLVTSDPIVCIPQSFSGDSKSVNLLLWSGAMADFTGKYLHRLDGDLNVLNTVAL